MLPFVRFDRVDSTHESGQNVREAGESGRGGREEAPNLVVVSWKQVQAFFFFLFLRKGK